MPQPEDIDVSAKVMPIPEQLQHLKAMTVRLGSIHEAQSLQLRNWPLLVPGVAKAEVKVDLDTHTVKMTCESKGKFRATKLARRWVRNIEAWSRAILWDDTSLLFEVDGRRIEPMEDEDVGQQEHPTGNDDPAA